MDYLQRTLQAVVTIWLSLTVIILGAFGLSESLRLAGIERSQNLFITFIVSLGLVLLVLWLLPRSFLTLKEEHHDEIRQTYIQLVLQSLSILWVALALILVATIGLYAALGRAGVERNENLLITFIVSLGLILLVLWLLPRSFLTLKEEKELDNE